MTLFPDLPETLYRCLARNSARSKATSHSIDLVGASERRIRHAGEFPAEIFQLRFIQAIGVRSGHL